MKPQNVTLNPSNRPARVGEGPISFIQCNIQFQFPFARLSRAMAGADVADLIGKKRYASWLISGARVCVRARGHVSLSLNTKRRRWRRRRRRRNLFAHCRRISIDDSGGGGDISSPTSPSPAGRPTGALNCLQISLVFAIISVQPNRLMGKMLGPSCRRESRSQK